MSGPSYAYVGLRSLLPEHLEYLGMKNRSATFIHSTERCLTYFIDWCEDRGVARVDEVTRPVVEKYQRWLFLARKKNGKPLSVSTQYGRLTAVKMFFRWAARQRHVMHNPTSELELPRLPTRLPQDVLTPAEAEQVLNQADVTDIFGLRDRAMMEVLYSTGIRRRELANLRVEEVGHERGTLMVRQGKGQRDRVVPVGERALQWIRRYLDEAREQLVVDGENTTLFLSATGEALHPDYLSRMMRQYVEQAKIGKRGSCHLFRHTMATAMLENGADIRFIQAMLGHARLDATMIYTHVSIGKLKEIHTATHPAGRGPKGPPPTTTPQEDAPRSVLLDELAQDAHEEADASASAVEEAER